MQRVDLQITEQLEKKGYQKLFQDIGYVYGRTEEDAIYVVALVDGDRSTAEGIKRLDASIARRLADQPKKKISLLNLLLTQNDVFEDHLKQIVAKTEQVWVFSEVYGILYIFENQPEDFDGLRVTLDKEITAEVTSWTARCKELLGVVPFVLVLVNTLIYIASILTVDDTGESSLMYVMNNNLYDVTVRKQNFRVITSVFYHFSFSHLFSNMVVLVALGANVERRIGKGWFLVSYLFCGCAASVCSLVHSYIENTNISSAGASGAICGLMGMLIAFSIFKKDEKKGNSFVSLLILAVLTILNGFLATESIDNAAHIGGLIAGILTGAICALMQSIIANRRKKDGRADNGRWL